MNAFSKAYQPVITTDDLKPHRAPKAKPNVFDTGTPQERMARHAQPLPTERQRAPNRPSTM